MIRHYRLEGKEVLECGLMEWARAFEDTRGRIVRQDRLPDGKFLSTVFLGLDHSFGEGPPLIFETMLFSRGKVRLPGAAPPLGDEMYCGRTSTWQGAEMMHFMVLEDVLRGVCPNCGRTWKWKNRYTRRCRCQS